MGLKTKTYHELQQMLRELNANDPDNYQRIAEVRGALRRKVIKAKHQMSAAELVAEVHAKKMAHKEKQDG